MQILPLTIVIISLILIGIIIGLFIQGKISDMHRHVDAVYNELKLEVAVLHTRTTELERGKNDTTVDCKTISEREEITDPAFRWNK